VSLINKSTDHHLRHNNYFLVRQDWHANPRRSRSELCAARAKKGQRERVRQEYQRGWRVRGASGGS
jgi:hypothetical protein